jgi:hypothetical protein
MSWRPHPVIDQLPPSDSRLVRDEARKLGFEEVAQHSSAVEIAAGARWVFCSPSTVAVDLLASGVLPVMLDRQHSIADSSMNRFPGADADSAGLAQLLSRLADDSAYEDAFLATWRDVAPAGRLDLRSAAVAVS